MRKLRLKLDKKNLFAVSILSFLIILGLFSSNVFSQQVSTSSTNGGNNENQDLEAGISVFGFIEKIAGQRDFFISTKLTFDMIEGEERKIFTTSFDIKINNLEDFTFYLKGPEIFKGIIVKYNLITGKVEYSYDKVKTSQNVMADVSQITSIIQSITDFLSTPIFDTKEVKGGVEFRPKNAQLLAKFGVQPIVLSLKMVNNIPTKIEIGNDKTDEKVTLEFQKFIIGG
ncbi:MAG TPA: hypothetical protein PKI14_03110 [Fervidobacterium sp.]|nr:hypothetical protein [Fervidobacterium sp.]HOK87793.1 hypothetical protein [Fervidobacterium sp.]HOM74129.1 hypothetical protein [Fervidobacterium sp.]HOQ39588.1 hypothetical protein [Fervidobacterium sp.]HPP17780.1 hypothetical protein [Fervidobacterium sp.]